MSLNYWNLDKMKIGTMWAAGTAVPMNGTIDGDALVDAGSGQVTVAMDGHAFSAGSFMRIQNLSSATALNKIHSLYSVATNDFNILAPYTADAVAGTELIGPAVGPGCIGIGPDTPWMLLDVRLTLSAVGDASENFTATEDSSRVATLCDNQFITFDTNTEQFYSSVVAGLGRREYCGGDYVDFAWANGGTARNWGLEVKYGVM